MNAMLATPSHQSPLPRRPLPPYPQSARPFVPAIPPRLVLHVLVGALAIVAVRAFVGSPLLADGRDTPAVTVVYAGENTATTSVSAPALSTARRTAEAPSQQSGERGGVMGELSATIGRSAATAAVTWRGTAGQASNLRSQPNRSRPPVGELRPGAPVEVVRWVAGEEVESHNDTWAELSDGTFVFSTALRRTLPTTAPVLPADAPTAGRWIDVNLTEQIVTAYDGRTAVKSALASTGRPGWDTPTGVFPILRRLEKDDMDGATLVGQGPNGTGATYKVEGVRHVQYFTQDGSAIHENYWRRPATFGMPGSHGCIGMAPADAAWFWSFATVGTPLVIHE